MKMTSWLQFCYYTVCLVVVSYCCASKCVNWHAHWTWLFVQRYIRLRTPWYEANTMLASQALGQQDIPKWTDVILLEGKAYKSSIDMIQTTRMYISSVSTVTKLHVILLKYANGICIQQKYFLQRRHNENCRNRMNITKVAHAVPVLDRK